MKLRHVSPVATYLSIERDDLLNGAELEPSLCRCFSVAQMPTNLKRSASFPVYNIPHVAVANRRGNVTETKDTDHLSSSISRYIQATQKNAKKLTVNFNPKVESRVSKEIHNVKRRYRSSMGLNEKHLFTCQYERTDYRLILVNSIYILAYIIHGAYTYNIRHHSKLKWNKTRRSFAARMLHGPSKVDNLPV